MEVYLSRNHQTCLHLFPLSVGRFQDVFDQPNGPDGQPPHFVISRFVSHVEALDRNLKGLAIWDLSGLAQLNTLVERVERMSGRDLQIFSGALDLEPINSPADALHVSQQMDHYERIEGAATEEKLGRWLVEQGESDIRFPEEVRPYLDCAAIGSRYHDCHGGVFTPEGYVRRREAVPVLKKDTVICLTLATTERSDTLLLPASEEQMAETKKTLEIDDFSQAVIASVKYNDMAYWFKRRTRQMFRVKGVSWWPQELPSNEEYAEAVRNLKRVNWKVDCILTHCAPTSIQQKLDRSYTPDRLTDFLQLVKRRCQFNYWFLGHYHRNRVVDDRFIVQWEQMVELLWEKQRHDMIPLRRKPSEGAEGLRVGDFK